MKKAHYLAGDMKRALGAFHPGCSRNGRHITVYCEDSGKISTGHLIHI